MNMVNSKQSNEDSGSVLSRTLSEKTFLGLKLWVAIGICVGFLIAVILLLVICCFSCRSEKRRRVKHSSGFIPVISKEIVEVKADRLENVFTEAGIGFSDSGKEDLERNEKALVVRDEDKGFSGGNRSTESNVSSGTQSSSVSDVSQFGWGRWYMLKELEAATDGFSSGNMIGEGGYGVVYRGLLSDGSVIAIKKLLNNKGQAEKEFRVEVEAIGKVRHKNLVGLVGYCAEGVHRMVVYEYVDNGNLEQWLHGDVGPISPLTWDIRMKIAIGTAKGLAYLHEGLEPKVVHRDVKSSNILLDKQWNSKISDFGLAKLLASDSSFVTTRVMGTFGYVAPEYASTGMLNEGSDVYSFGVLLMEIITGRSPVDYSRPAGEVNLIDWFKGMVVSRRGEEVVDPLVEVKPPPRALKRTLLICLRCIDLDAQKRPKMGQIVHMLEAAEFPFHAEHRAMREGARASPVLAERERVSSAPPKNRPGDFYFEGTR